MIVPFHDNEGYPDDPCLSCSKSYVEDIWGELCCDYQENCPFLHNNYKE